jgi:trehalose 6-phosphate phosphatase
VNGDLDALLDPLRADPSTAGVLSDFDGTLSAIVDDPAAARPLAGAVTALAALAQRYAVVAVLSGRPADFLDGLLPPDVVVSGLYGLERVRNGVRSDHPNAGAWREVVADVVAAGRASAPDGALVEPKGLSLTVHYRTRPEVAAEVQAWAERQAARTGLEIRQAKMSVELHPPIRVDKGSALLELAAGLKAVCFLGDDVGDLPAYEALGQLRAAGVATVGIAVRTGETPAAVQAAADLLVDGPEGALEILRSLAA